MPMILLLCIIGAAPRRAPGDRRDARYMYLYSDGYPDTVEFYFSDGRLRRLEWTYWVE